MVRLALSVTFALVLGACAKKHARPTTAGPQASVAVHDWTRFAADGMCSDQIAKRWDREYRWRKRFIRTLLRKIAVMNVDRAAGRNVSESEDFVREGWVQLKNATQSFDLKFAPFECVRRSDGEILTSKKLNAGLDVITTLVESLGPLPLVRPMPLSEVD